MDRSCRPFDVGFKEVLKVLGFFCRERFGHEYLNQILGDEHLSRRCAVQCHKFVAAWLQYVDR